MVLLEIYSAPMALRLFALGLCVAAGLMVLVAHLTRPTVKRLVAAAALACVLGSVGSVVLRADDGFVILDPCKDLTPSDWQWWVYGCMWP